MAPFLLTASQDKMIDRIGFFKSGMCYGCGTEEPSPEPRSELFPIVSSDFYIRTSLHGTLICKRLYDINYIKNILKGVVHSVHCTQDALF